MTRINAGVHPTELPSKLLLAEHREITRIPNAVLARGVNSSIPAVFALGTGHVRFFYNKLKFLHLRYQDLYRECLDRGYNVTYKGESFERARSLYPSLYNDYDAGLLDRQLIVDRIESKGFTLL